MCVATHPAAYHSIMLHYRIPKRQAIIPKFSSLIYTGLGRVYEFRTLIQVQRVRRLHLCSITDVIDFRFSVNIFFVC